MSILTAHDQLTSAGLHRPTTHVFTLDQSNPFTILFLFLILLKTRSQQK